MQKKPARIILVLVAGLWIATVWALSVGAVEPDDPQIYRTHCPIPQDPEPACEELGFDHPPADGSASPSGRASPSRSASPSGSASSSPSGSSPPGSSPSPSASSSPSPSPSQTTPPPPSVETADSKVTAKFARRAFRGRVTSESNRCVRGRKVVVKKVRKGKDRKIGSDKTNAQGRWSFGAHQPGSGGRYYAKVLRKSVQAPNNVTIICKADRSRTFRP